MSLPTTTGPIEPIMTSTRSSRPITSNWFFVVTLLIATVAWIIALVGQSIVTANISNITIGPLWLAFLIQLLILLQLLSALSSPSPSSLQTHIPLLTTLLPISTVLASIGIDSNLFPPTQPTSKKLTVAGWMITAIINCIWILALTAGEGTRTRKVFDIIIGDSSGSTATASGRGSTVAAGEPGGYTYDPGYGIGAPPAIGNQGITPNKYKPRFSFGIPLSTRLYRRPRNPPEYQTQNQNLPENGNGTTNTSTNANANQDPTTHSPPHELAPIPSVRTPSDAFSPYAPAPPPSDGTRTSFSRTDRGRDPVLSGAGSGGSSVTQPDVAGQGQGRYSGPMTNEPEQISGPGTGPGTPLVRAQAQYAYTASTADPSELSFKKGEILEILDRSGKWWEARKQDGSTGIAPSNYLRLL